MSSTRRKKPVGAVALVAAGPGDPSLLTVRAAELLAGAELVVADPAVRGLAGVCAPGAEVAPRDDDGGVGLDRAARARLVVEAARAGRAVVRLLAGDPVLDGALAEEAAALHRARVPFEAVPGVGTVTGVACYAGFTLVGGRAHEVHVVDGADPDVDWAAFCSPRTTLVVTDGADTAVEIAKSLLAAGRPGGTPVAVTRGGTTVEQHTVATTLEGLEEAVKAAASPPGPGLLVVGEVVAQRDRLSWFETKPLFGWRVLVPRTKEQAGALSCRLAGFGAVPVEVPTISVEPPRTPQQMERAVHGLVSGRYEWVAFTSTNAVRAVRERFEQYGLDARSFAGLKVAAVGEATAAALRDFGVVPDLVPVGEQSSAGLLEEWPDFDPVVDPIDRVFLPRADIATETLVAGLVERGWEVDDVTAYRTVRAAPPPAETREAIKTGGFDAVLFTSSSTVRNLVGIAGKPHPLTVVACIGPATAATAAEHGLRVDVQPERAGIPDLVEALAAHAEGLRLAAAAAGETCWRPSRRRPAARRR